MKSLFQLKGLAYERGLAHDAEFPDHGVIEVLLVVPDALAARERAAMAAGEKTDGVVLRKVELGVAHEAFDGRFERALDVGEQRGYDLATEVERESLDLGHDALARKTGSLGLRICMSACVRET